MARLGIAEDHFFILGYPDRGLRRILQKPDDVIRSQSTRELSVPYSDAMSPGNPYSYANLSNDLRRVVEIADPTIVIAPVSFDVHPDHSAAADLTDGVLATMNVHPERLGYLVHTSRLPRSLVWLQLAPVVERAGPAVEVLATVDGRPVLCRQGPVLVSAFHPELSGDFRLHQLFLGGL